ncbi:MAG TPA: hypothetical protein VL738_24220 [Dactylosporangium sp.]|jgi:hypothetical protein|nr:hypothetical protein [Dactylosporangium sp.]
MLRDALLPLVGVLSSTIIVLTALSAAHTLVVPRGTSVLLTRWVMAAVRAAFDVRLRWARGYAERDRILVLFGPVTLMALPGVWLTLTLIGFAGLYWSLGVRPWQNAVLDSGSSLLTLGFHQPGGLLTGGLQLVEAALGLSLLALVVSYIPALYSSYTRREVLVTALEAEAGTPPSAVRLLERLLEADGLALLDGYWHEWTRWFNEIEETHSSNPLLVFFRSPSPERHWVTAAGTVLDAAALVCSSFTLGEVRPAHAELCLRAGTLALRRVGDYFRMPEQSGAAVAIGRAEYDEAYQRLRRAGARLCGDPDRCWRDFVMHRAAYEATLLQFASLTTAPSAMWSADRPIPFHRLPITRRHAEPWL